MSEIVFAVGVYEGRAAVFVSEKSYWEEVGYLQDSWPDEDLFVEVECILRQFGFGEMSESMFLDELEPVVDVNGVEHVRSVADVEAELSSVSGFTFDPEFRKFLLVTGALF